MSAWDVLAYFWPFFAIDFVRYTVLDGIAVLRYLYKWRMQDGEEGERKEARRQLYREYPRVTVIIPGKDEGFNLGPLVDSLHRQTYGNLEIVDDDDGSEDRTPEIGRRMEKDGRIDRFLRQRVRGGKASAANTGLWGRGGRRSGGERLRKSHDPRAGVRVPEDDYPWADGKQRVRNPPDCGQGLRHLSDRHPSASRRLGCGTGAGWGSHSQAAETRAEDSAHARIGLLYESANEPGVPGETALSVEPVSRPLSDAEAQQPATPKEPVWLD